MSENRNERREKLNKDKFVKLRAKEIRIKHKTVSKLSQSEIYHLENDLNKDYFPVE